MNANWGGRRGKNVVVRAARRGFGVRVGSDGGCGFWRFCKPTETDRFGEGWGMGLRGKWWGWGGGGGVGGVGGGWGVGVGRWGRAGRGGGRWVDAPIVCASILRGG